MNFKKWFFILVAVNVVLLLVFAAGAAIVIGKFESTMARVEAHEEILANENSNLKKVAEQEKQKREAADALVAQLQQDMETRHKETQRLLKEVGAPKPPEQVAHDAQYYLGVAAVLQPDGKFILEAGAVQELMEVRIERDLLQKDVTDLRRINEQQSMQLVSFATQLRETQQQLTETQKVMKEYKGVAQKSRFRKVMGVGVRIGEIGAAAAAGFWLGRLF